MPLGSLQLNISMNSNIEAPQGGILDGFEMESRVRVELHYQREDGDPSAEWRLSEQDSYYGTVVGGPAVSRFFQYEEGADYYVGGVNVLRDVKRGSENKIVEVYPPRYIKPREWYEQAGDSREQSDGGNKLLLRRSVRLITPDEDPLA